MQVFTLAYRLKHLLALTWFSNALVHTATRDRKLFKRLAEEVSVFSLVDRGEGIPLLAEDAHLSILLRYAQFRVAIATENGRHATTLLDRLLHEIDRLKDDKKSDRLLLVLGTALMERSVSLPAKRWLAMLRTFIALPAMHRFLSRKPSYTDPFSGLTLSATQDELIFVVRATALSGFAELAELVEALDAETAEVRERYLTSASNVSHSITHVVSSAWLSDVRVSGFDARAAASTLHRIRETAERWKNPDMAIELACAEAVMLDEYVCDKIAR